MPQPRQHDRRQGWRWPATLAFAIALLTTATHGGGALQARQEDGFWSFLRAGTVVAPCGENSPQAKDTMKALQTLDAKIDSVTAASPLRPLIDEFHRLLRTPCFHMAVENGDPPTFSHVLSLQAWWLETGRSWLAGYLKETRYGLSTDLKRITVFPAEPRAVLLAEGLSNPALRPLVCAPEKECPGVGGWRERAEDALTPRTPPLYSSDEPPTSPSKACEQHARTAKSEDAYQAYRSCLGGDLGYDVYKEMGMTSPHDRSTISSLPIGNFQAPTDGWLAVSGRRGHYDFCDGVAVFNLQTGDAFKSDSCSDLQLRRDGSVDFNATDRKRRGQPVRGTASADNLRELVWMLLMKDTVESRKRGESFPIPNAYARRWTAKEINGGVLGGSFGGSTAQTVLAWTWVAPDGQVRAKGNLTWPPWFWSPNLAEAHAASLLSVMEGSLTPGCPNPPPPAVEGVLLRGMGGDSALENLIDAAPSEEVKAAMREMLKKRRDAQPKREPVDPRIEATSPSRSLTALFREPCRP